MKIEKKCKCETCRIECYGTHESWWDRSCLNAINQADNYCPHCGYRLADDGWAYEMVRLPDKPHMANDDGGWVNLSHKIQQGPRALYYVIPADETSEADNERSDDDGLG